MIGIFSKTFFACCLLFFFFLNPIAASAAANPYEELPMSSAALEAGSGRLMAGKNFNQTLPLASLTKLMTALVLLDLRINLEKKVVITQAEINYTEPFIEAGDVTSKINLRAGDKVKLNDLWHAMLIASSNEAAVALVDNSGVSRKQFVKKMNSKAKALGLGHVKFTEPTGIDPKNIGTAKEMAVIARKAFAYKSIRNDSAESSYVFKDLITGRRIGVYSRNTSLLAMKPSGMKVGYLTEAKLNVAIRLKKAGKDRIIVIMHAPSSAKRNAEINRIMAKK